MPRRRRLFSSRLAFLLLGSAGLRCSDDPTLETPDREVCLVRRDGARYCIDVYEASRRDSTDTSAGTDGDSPPRSLERKLPWVDVVWDAARAACESKGKRLCERDEWIDACDGEVGEERGTPYTYGSTLDATRCNTGGAAAEPTGLRATCSQVASGTFDQSGNVWEWTGNVASAAATRGGGWRSSMVHECKSGDGRELFPPSRPSPEVGFRCCRNQ